MVTRWSDSLPSPIAFVLSGGASLGSVQVGMMRALCKAGIQPDLVVGTSVGSLNGAVIAENGLEQATDILTDLWMGLRKEDIFPGNLLLQAYRLLWAQQSLFSAHRLEELICDTLQARQFEELQLPFGALATELLTHRGTLFTQGELRPALLASTAIPGIYPSIQINEKHYIDGGFSANVPLQAAAQMGAASVVVLDAGNTCRAVTASSSLSELFVSIIGAALRQRVLVEAPMLAKSLPIVYLPTPCPVQAGITEFERSRELIEQTEQLVSKFLATTAPPAPGSMSGAPHFHDSQLAGGQALLAAA